MPKTARKMSRMDTNIRIQSIWSTTKCNAKLQWQKHFGLNSQAKSTSKHGSNPNPNGPNGLPGSISATNSSSSVASTADLTLYIVFGVAILVFVLVLIIIVKILKRKNPNPNGYTLTSTGKNLRTIFFVKSQGAKLELSHLTVFPTYHFPNLLGT